MVIMRYVFYSKRRSTNCVPAVLKPKSEHSPISVLGIPIDRFRCTHRMRARRDTQNASEEAY
jgi:hypothetical protein